MQSYNGSIGSGWCVVGESHVHRAQLTRTSASPRFLPPQSPLLCVVSRVEEDITSQDNAMLGKFRPPLLTTAKQSSEEAAEDGSVPPAKRRRLSERGGEDEPRKIPQLVFKNPGISSLPRNPLCVVPNPAVAARSAAIDGRVEDYYNVLW